MIRDDVNLYVGDYRTDWWIDIIMDTPQYRLDFQRVINGTKVLIDTKRM